MARKEYPDTGEPIEVQAGHNPSIEEFEYLKYLEGKFSSAKEAKKHKVGKLFYAIPYHICPTVAKHNKAYTVIKSKKTGTWNIDARDYI